MRVLVNELFESDVFKNACGKLPAGFAVRSTDEPLSYSITEGDEEVCVLEGYIDGVCVIIDVLRIRSRSDAAYLLYLLRRMIYEIEEESGNDIAYVNFDLGEEREEILKNAFSNEELVILSADEVEHPQASMCLVKLMTLRAALEECGDALPASSEPEIYIDGDGLPMILMDTADENEKLWFKYRYFEGDIFILHAAVWHVDEDEYVNYTEWEEDADDTADYEELLTEWGRSIAG